MHGTECTHYNIPSSHSLLILSGPFKYSPWSLNHTITENWKMADWWCESSFRELRPMPFLIFLEIGGDRQSYDVCTILLFCVNHPETWGLLACVSHSLNRLCYALFSPHGWQQKLVNHHLFSVRWGFKPETSTASFYLIELHPNLNICSF